MLRESTHFSLFGLPQARQNTRDQPTVTAQTANQAPAVRFFARLFAAAVALFFVVYSVDLCWYHLRAAVPKLDSPNSSVHRVRLLAIPNKGNKVEYQIDALRPEEDVPCSRSLFPHAQRKPCWYVTRHAKDPIPM
jgi:hypothetical protein